MPAAGSGKHAHLNGGKGLANNESAGGYEPGWVASDDSKIAPTDGNLACDSQFATWTFAPADRENLPISCANWWEAYAFCIWDGGFLPSEAEWEYVAASGSEQLDYPWGSDAPGTSNQYALYGCDYPSGSGTCTNLANIAPVGTPALGVARWGQLDMAGEVLQWTMDWYAAYLGSTDCADLSTASSRVLRSHTFKYGPSISSLPAARSADSPTDRNLENGVRCVRAPQTG